MLAYFAASKSEQLIPEETGSPAGDQITNFDEIHDSSSEQESKHNRLSWDHKNKSLTSENRHKCKQVVTSLWAAFSKGFNAERLSGFM